MKFALCVQQLIKARICASWGIGSRPSVHEAWWRRLTEACAAECVRNGLGRVLETTHWHVHAVASQPSNGEPSARGGGGASTTLSCVASFNSLAEPSAGFWGSTVKTRSLSFVCSCLVHFRGAEEKGKENEEEKVNKRNRKRRERAS